MKKISLFITTLCLLLFFSSCEEDMDKFTVNNTAPIALSPLSVTDIELDEFNVNNPSATFNWTSADYGQQTVINYSLEFAADNTFTNKIIAGTVSGENSISLSVGELNSAAGEAGLPPFEWNTLYARVVTSLGSQNGVAVVSNTISFNVYPYFNYPFMDYYLVGAATQPGWNNNNNNPPLFRDANNPNLYRYVGYFGADQFKVLEVKGLWQPQWGTNDGSSIAVNPGTGTDPGTFPLNNNPIPSAGYYIFTINYGNNTFSFVPYTGSTSGSFTSISIQGTSSSTTSMTQSTFDSHIWYLNSIRLTPGELQFSTNTGSVWSATTAFSGTATQNGGSIPVLVEDDYDIWFNDLTGHYIMIPLNL